MTSPDIKRLQIILSFDPDTKIADSGPGSLGNETEYFGSLTRAALRKFQKKHGIVSSGDENTTGYGLLRPKTRAKIQEVFKQ
jgi:peptidoglycan hydrolase-like protein with peptidoglycan-binding domain